MSKYTLPTLLFCTFAPVAFAQEASFTTGPANIINSGLVDCGRGSRVSPVGEMTSEDGTI